MNQLNLSDKSPSSLLWNLGQVLLDRSKVLETNKTTSHRHRASDQSHNHYESVEEVKEKAKKDQGTTNIILLFCLCYLTFPYTILHVVHM